MDFHFIKDDVAPSNSLCHTFLYKKKKITPSLLSSYCFGIVYLTWVLASWTTRVPGLLIHIFLTYILILIIKGYYFVIVITIIHNTPVLHSCGQMYCSHQCLSVPAISQTLFIGFGSNLAGWLELGDYSWWLLLGAKHRKCWTLLYFLALFSIYEAPRMVLWKVVTFGILVGKGWIVQSEIDQNLNRIISCHSFRPSSLVKYV